MISDPCKDGSKIGFRIDAVRLGGLDQRENAGSTFAAFIRSGKEPVVSVM
jgi:hypothetical protein